VTKLSVNGMWRGCTVTTLTGGAGRGCLRGAAGLSQAASAAQTATTPRKRMEMFGSIFDLQGYG